MKPVERSSGVNRREIIPAEKPAKKSAGVSSGPKSPGDRFAPGEHKAPDYTGYTRYNPPSFSGPVEKKWTVLCYFAGDCNMEEYMAQDILALEKAGSSPTVNLLAQIDRGDNSPALKWGGKPGGVRYYLQKSHDRQHISSPEIKDLGQVNSRDPQTLEDFLSWGMKNFPAKNYLIFAYGHGSGVTGLLTDEGSGPGYMKLPEFKNAVEKAEESAGVDKSQVVLGLKSCLMGQVETAYELKDTADYLLASQSAIGVESWRLDQIAAKRGLEDFSPEKMADFLFVTNSVERVQFTPAGMPTLKSPIETSVLTDLREMKNLQKALNKFKLALEKSPEKPENLKKLLEIRSRAAYFDNTDLSHFVSDLGVMARQFTQAEDLNDPVLKEAAKNLTAAIGKTVVKKSNWNDNEHDKSQGLGIFAPSNPEIYKLAEYRDLALEKDTGWSQLMTGYAKGLEAAEMDAQLSDRVIKDERLTGFSAAAKNALAEPVKLKAEIKEAVKDIAVLQQDPQATRLENVGKAFSRLSKVGAVKSLWENLGKAPEKGEMPEYRKTMETLLRFAVQRSAAAPQLAPAYLRAGLEVISALEGEISSKTLAGGAANLLKAEKSIKNPERREILVKTGAEMLTILGYATRNEKIINLKNYSGVDPTAFLRSLINLGKKG